jgi:hypothetical protein
MEDSFVKASDSGSSANTPLIGSILGNTDVEKALLEVAPDKGDAAAQGKAGGIQKALPVWDEVEHLGLIPTAAAIPGPVGMCLSESARRGLSDVVSRLQEKGLCFERRRMLRIPLAMDKYVPATTEEVVDAFSQGKPNARIAYSRSQAVAPSTQHYLPEEHVPVKSLGEMRGLDGVYGLGAEALPADERALMEAVNDLTALHWDFGTNHEACTYDRKLFKPFAIWQALHEGKQIYIARQGDRDCIELDRDGLLAMAMLETGRDHGVKNPGTIQGIIALRNSGAQTGYGRKGAELELYKTLCRHHPARLGMATEATISLCPEDISDPPAVLKRLKKLDDLREQYLAAPLHRTINHQDYNLVYDFCMEPSMRFSPHVRAAALRDLFPAASNRHGYVEMSFLFDLARRLEASATDELDLKRLVASYMADLYRKGATNPGEINERPPVSRPANIQPQPGHERLLGIYRQFLEAAQSEGAASDGLDLVRIPAGKDTEEQRIQLFNDLAKASMEKNRKKTADAYRALLAHRRQAQSLTEAGQAMMKIMKYLGTCDKQDCAIDVFAELQQMNDRGAGSDDEMLIAFGKTLALSGSVDDALKAARQALPNDTGPEAQRSITIDDDTVNIGGVILKKHGAEETSPRDEAEPEDSPVVSSQWEPSAAVPAITIPELEKISRQCLDAALATKINYRNDFVPLYQYLLKPKQRFTPQVRGEALRDLIPLMTNPNGYLEVRTLLTTMERIEKRPANDVELTWLVRNYISMINERHGPYGTDADGPNGPHVSTPPEMFEDLVRQQGGGVFAVLLMTTTRAEVRKWKADKLVENGDLSVAHTSKEHVREARAALLKQLEDSTGSCQAGADALTMLSIPAGRETEMDRVNLLTDIIGADRKDLAARHYRAILIYRRPDQDLIEAGRSYLELLKSLSAISQQDRIVEVFSALQQAPERGLETFRQKISKGSTVDEALDAAKAPKTDTIIVGGAVLKMDR